MQLERMRDVDADPETRHTFCYAQDSYQTRHTGRSCAYVLRSEVRFESRKKGNIKWYVTVCGM